MTRRTLRSRIGAGLLVYSLAVAAGVLLLGYLANESVEAVIWNSLLDAELERFENERLRNPDSPAPQSGTLRAYAVAQDAAGLAQLPDGLRALPPGLHDEIFVAGREVAALVRDSGTQRYIVTVDITELEADERSMTGVLLSATLFAAALLALAAWWLAGRLFRPVQALAQSVDALDPAVRGNRIQVDANATAEVAIIAGAVNRLAERSEGFVSRERTFIDTASHELRTPIAVILGASELAAEQPDLPEPLRKPLQRILRAARQIDQLINTLLVLAKSPERLSAGAVDFALDELLRDIVADHMPLTTEKSLEVRIGALAPGTVRAPARIAQVAIANLLRNAIEHSDLGTVEVSIAPAGVVNILDPGHGMAAEDIGRLYANLARRGDAGPLRGIGLELIARICEHLGWTLDIRPRDGGGTLAVLDLRSSLIVPSPGDDAGHSDPT